MSTPAQPASGTLTHTISGGLTLISHKGANGVVTSDIAAAPASDAAASTSDPTSVAPATTPEQTQSKSSALNIPSRTSSQQNPKSTTTPSKPNTQSEDPPAARRGSKRSILTRSRNNSRSSRRSARGTRGAESKEAVPPLPAQNDGTRSEKKPRSGFLAFLNCCSPSDTVQESKEEPPVPAKKTTVPPTQTKASRPAEPLAAPNEKEPDSKPLSEKPVQKEEDEEKADSATKDGALGVQSNADDEILNEKAVQKDITSQPTERPYISGVPDPETGLVITDYYYNDGDDTPMPDAPPVVEKDTEKKDLPVDEPAQPADLQPQVQLPPPPPLSQRQEQVGTVPAVPEAPEKQNWLLPPAQPPLKGRKCLILDLDETLVHSSFKILNQADFTIPVEIEGQYHNVYVIKRPGVDQFMKRVGELYEVVVFTASVSKYGDPLLDQLDIHHVVHHRLFRESCYNHQGNYVKVS